MTTDAVSSVSRSLRIEDLADNEPTAVSIVAGPEERLALASQLDVPRLDAFAADFVVLREAGGRLRVEGEVRATLTRICVVTLEPFETLVREPVKLDFASEEQASAEAARQAHEPAAGETLADQPDPPDPIVDGRVDLGAVAVEFLSLSLDPYPRKPGASFVPPPSTDSADESPFKALEKLKFDHK